MFTVKRFEARTGAEDAPVIRRATRKSNKNYCRYRDIRKGWYRIFSSFRPKNIANFHLQKRFRARRRVYEPKHRSGRIMQEVSTNRVQNNKFSAIFPLLNIIPSTAGVFYFLLRKQFQINVSVSRPESASNWYRILSIEVIKRPIYHVFAYVQTRQQNIRIAADLTLVYALGSVVSFIAKTGKALWNEQ